MRQISWLSAIGLLTILLVCQAAPAPVPPATFDWPQWQGPDRTGLSREKGLLQSWPKAGPKLLWQARDLGEGFSTPTVAAGRIFSMGNVDKTEFVMAFAEKDGARLWSTPLGLVRAGGGGYPGPRSSPTVDGDRVYALGLNGDLICVEAASGKEIWMRDLRSKKFNGKVGGWGYSESPLIDGDRVLITPGGAEATLVALDKKTGDLIWKGVVPKGDEAHYSSIIKATVHGEKQYIQFLSGGVVGFSPDGTFLWRYDHPHNGTANCSTPICIDNQVFAASDYGTGGGLADLVKKDGKYKAEEVYFTKEMKNHHGGMVLVDGYLYGDNGGQLTCIDFKTGKVAWKSGKAGKGAILYADGRLYYRKQDGPMLLVEANPEKYVEVGRFEQPHRSNREAWPHPIVANGRLYLRDQDELFCYDVQRH